VRVVDFFPPELELFAHCTTDLAWDKRSKKQVAENGQPKSRWEWAFVLLLEDAKIPPNTVSEKLRVVVNNDAAQYLLGMNAQEYVFYRLLTSIPTNHSTVSKVTRGYGGSSRRSSSFSGETCSS
jgi:hypothetical protein